MSRLSAKEQDLLQRIADKEELRPLFFRKVKGLKWFDPLAKEGYFNPEENPKPVSAKEEGYVNIPYWLVVDYLVKTTPELAHDKNREYAEKFLQVLVDVTVYAKKNEISNYRTWWRFAEIISQIPYDSIPIEMIDIVDYWLDDKYERGLVASVIGKKWLPKLLQTNDPHSLQLAKRIIEFLFKIIFSDKYGDKERQEALFRFDNYHAQKITESIATLAGEKLGLEVIKIFDAYLKNILKQLGNDLWSSFWQPAIEDHEQNKHRDDAGNILIQAYRDSINGYIHTNSDEATTYVKSMLESEYQTIERLAIYVISRKCHLFTDVIDILLDKKYLGSNYQHEMWHFLNKSYPKFSDLQKEKALKLISCITRQDDKGEIHKGASAYNKAIWLSAIKDHGDREAELYTENVEIAETEPDHPDFSSYMSVGWGGRESPKTLEELQALSIDELVQELENYKDPGGFDGPGLEGLVKVLKQLAKIEPLNFYLNLNKFINLDLAYIYEIIEAYRDLWAEKAKLPWDEIWGKLLDFCSIIIAQDRFWDPENSKQREAFVATRYWIVNSIGRLIEAGTKSDEHAFNEVHLSDAEKILAFLLNKEVGDGYKEDSDAVSISINSPRGHCLEALINLTLRSCRIAHKNNSKDHDGIWAHFQHYYDSELDRADSENPEYEFATLVTNHLPNFLYMSKKWTLENLSRIFDQNHYLKWLCAMQGYSYVGTIYPEIYNYLRKHGDLLKALDDENIRDRVEEKAIQNIAIAYISDFESFEKDNNLINVLITRNDQKEISHLIWFIWTLETKVDDKLKNKIYELWPKIQQNIDLSTKEGRRMASQLCYWAVFVEQIDEERRQLLLAIAPFSDESHNSYELLKSISEISKTQPFEAHEIWMKMLEGSTPDYPEEAVRKLFTNLLKKGPEGLQKARAAENEYLKKGNNRPTLWLREIKQEYLSLE